MKNTVIKSFTSAVFTFSIICLLLGISTPTMAQSEPIFKAGDTVSISYKYVQNEYYYCTYYLKAYQWNEYNVPQLTNVQCERSDFSSGVDETCLWVIMDDVNDNNTQFRIRTLKTFQIRYFVEGSGTPHYRDVVTTLRYNVNDLQTSENNPSAFYLKDQASCDKRVSYVGSLSYNYTGTSWRRLRYDNGNWRLYDDPSQKVTIHRWSKKNGTGDMQLNVSPNDVQRFNWGDNTARNLSVSAEYSTETYWYDVADPENHRFGQTTGVSYNTATELVNNLNASLSCHFVQQATNDPYYSRLYSANYDGVAAGDEARAVLVATAPTINGSNWQTTVNTSGNELLGLKTKDADTWCDYSDQLAIVLTYRVGGQNKSVTKYVECKRTGYHEVAVTEPFSVQGFTANHTFPPSTNLTFSLNDITVTYQNGALIYDSKGELCESASHQSGMSLQAFKAAHPDDVTITLQALDPEEAIPSNWLTPSTNSGNGPFSLTASANTLETERLAHILLRVTYTHLPESGVGDPITENVMLLGNFSQLAMGSGGTIELIHKGGASGDPMIDGRQQTHVAYTDLYYAQSKPVQLKLKEPFFSGYIRWYDYNTGRDPNRNTGGAKTDWNVTPQHNGSAFTEINSDDAHNHGRVAAYNVPGYTGLGTANVNSPEINGWSDAQTHIIACDVSNYTDFIFTSTSITEPTLSYRQLFTLRPGKECADSLEKCTTDGHYFEDYHYLVPDNKTAFLTPKFRYRPGSNHNRCYFYYYDYDNKDNNHIRNVGGDINRDWYDNATATWYRNGVEFTPTYPSGDEDFISVSRDSRTIDVYELKFSANSKTYNIARFIVEYIPSNESGPSASELISEEKIAAEYQMLEKNDFSYGAPAPGTTNAITSGKHVPWSDMSYGFTYPDNNNPTHQRNVHDPFPFYDEYALVNRVDNQYNKAQSHDGAANGYSLFVDGSVTPGVVATISTNATICSGQTMYCSAWVCNPNQDRDGTLPILRFDIQGRNAGDEEWQNVASFMMGELPNQYDNGNLDNRWKQIKFPVLSDKDYSQTRVCVYDFAQSNSQNDLMIDDICLFASKLPLSAYQANTTCQSGDIVNTVVRVDYPTLSSELENKFLYYDIYCINHDAPMVAYGGYYQSDPSIKVDDEWPTTFGSVRIPPRNHDPETNTTSPEFGDESDLVFPSITQFIDTVRAREDRGEETPKKCYINEAKRVGDTHWVMYLVQQLNNLTPSHRFLVRMASTHAELSNPQCALSTELPILSRTNIILDGRQVTSAHVDTCANGLFNIGMNVSNTINNGETIISASCLADFINDSLYTIFKDEHGYTDSDIKDAITNDLRRVGTEQDPNPNQFVASFYEIDPSVFKREANYDIIAQLVEDSVIIFAQRVLPLYMTSDRKVKFILYPIQETAFYEDPVTHQRTKLDICTDPQPLEIQTCASTHMLIMSTIPESQKTPEQRLQVPAIRIAAKDVNRAFKVPISEIHNTMVGWDSTQIVSSNDPYMQAKIDQYISSDTRTTSDPSRFSVRLAQDRVYQDVTPEEYYQTGCVDSIGFAPITTSHVNALIDRHSSDPKQTWTDGHPGYQHINTDGDTLRAGYEYLFRTTMLNTSFLTHDDAAACPVGESYINIKVVYDTIVWTPQGRAYNEWGDDLNWRGLRNGVIQENGYVPLASTMVIIPKLDNALLYPYISGLSHSIDANYKPAVCKNIYFAGYANILGQQNLDYEHAVVEMPVECADWYAKSAPLKAVYSGDLYKPATESKDLFTTASKPTNIGTTDAAAHIWASYYNKETRNLTADQGWMYSSATAEWTRSNSVNEALEPGSGFSILAYGKIGDPNWLDPYTIRLPKQEHGYGFVAADGGTSSNDTIYDIHREDAGRLAFEIDNATNESQTLHLHNGEVGRKFLFGNPAMTYIDMFRFLKDNNLLTRYYIMRESSWTCVNVLENTSPDRYLPPMTAVLIELKDAATPSKDLDVELKASHLVLRQGEVAKAYPTPASAPAPSRLEGNNLSTGFIRHGLLNITAFNEDAHGQASIFMTDLADNHYNPDEDALSITSGLDYRDAANVTTPVNVFTYTGDTALMLDTRHSISMIPLGFRIHPNYQSDSLYLCFNNSNWSDEIWLYDSYTGAQTNIYDGTLIRIARPADYEQRYYIKGNAIEDDDHTTPTSVEEVGMEKESDSPYDSLETVKWIQDGILIIRRGNCLYDAQGHLLRVLR